MHEDSMEDEMRRQQRIEVMKEMTRKIRSKGKMDAESRWWIAELLGGRLREGVAPSRRRRNDAKMV